MKKFLALAAASMFCFSTFTVIKAAEEKREIKQNKDGSWKMKIKRKGDKEFVGEYEGKTYTLRGGDFGPNFREDGEYTVYGSIAPEGYITTTRVEPYEVRETVTTPVVADEGNWRMRVTRRGNDWVGVHGDKTYELRGEHGLHEEGEYTVHGKLSNDGYITTTKVERFK